MKKSRNREEKSTGYAFKKPPGWLTKLQNDALKSAKITKNSRGRYFLLCLTNGQSYRKGVPQKFKNIDHLTVKEASTDMTRKYAKKWGEHPRAFFTPIPNIRARCFVLNPSNPVRDVIFGGMRVDADNQIDRLDYLDDVDGRAKYDVHIKEKLYESDCIVNGEYAIVFSKTPLKIHKNYDIIAFKYGEMVTSTERRTRNMRAMYYCMEAFEYKEDLTDVYDAMNIVKGYEQISPQWGYDEQTIKLILFGLMYMERDVPALNTIIFGDTQIGKSSLFKVIEKVFGENIISGTKATIKGLTGSHWEEGTSGALIDAKYVAIIDELFRLGKENTSFSPTSEYVVSLLNSLTEILEHSKKTAPSGKGSRTMLFDKSFLGSNNILDFNVFRQAWKVDPAPFNRLTLMLIPDDVTGKMRELTSTEGMSPPRFVDEFQSRLNKFGYNLTLYRKSFIVLRQSLSRVVLDKLKMSQYMKATEYCHESFFKPSKFEAYVKCETLFDYWFSGGKFPISHNVIIKPKDIHYLNAVNDMNVIVRDFKTIMGV